MKYVKGNLLDATQSVIAHGCNAQGVMGAGVARAIRDKWPNAYATYRKEYEERGLKLGDVVFHHYPWGQLTIANLITQSGYGNYKRQVDYEAVAQSLAKLAMHYSDVSLQMTEIAIPKIGAGLGGGSWAVIEAIIREIEETHPWVKFIVYVP